MSSIPPTSNDDATATVLVPCPRCGVKAPFSPRNTWRPFCSERCKMVDFGAWASEQFRIAPSPSSGFEPPDEDESMGAR